MQPLYLIIAFHLDRTINPCGTPCRSVVSTQTSHDAEEALRIGVFWEDEIPEFMGTSLEYHEVVVADMTGFDFTSRALGRINHMEGLNNG